MNKIKNLITDFNIINKVLNKILKMSLKKLKKFIRYIHQAKIKLKVNLF